MILNTQTKNFTLSALFNALVNALINAPSSARQMTAKDAAISRLKQMLSLFLMIASVAVSSLAIADSSASSDLSVTNGNKHILIYGDSLSAAYGMDEENGWVKLLADKLKPNYRVSNASISGETSSGGLARLPLTLEELSPELVLLELGANDGLRGQSTELLKANLASMIQAIKSSGAQAVLASISLPPTYGPRYIDQFRQVYFDLAEQYGVPLLDLYQPSFVETPGYIQEDGLHPTEVTQPIIRDLVLTFLIDNELIVNVAQPQS